MKISILTSDPKHRVVDSLRGWKDLMRQIGHDVQIFFDKKNLIGGDFLFLVSCAQIVRKSERDLFKYVLVLHASDLPIGRGWSPHIWSIIRGSNKIVVSLIEAEDIVDTGKVWVKESFKLYGHELLQEINEKLFNVELGLMTTAVENYAMIKPKIQVGDAGEYMHKRTPFDSELNIHQSIAEQFNILRIVDNEKYPAFFEYQGHKYVLKIEKVDRHEK
jgi:methionyl-tRNA formyltransferase